MTFPLIKGTHEKTKGGRVTTEGEVEEVTEFRIEYWKGLGIKVRSIKIG